MRLSISARLIGINLITVVVILPLFGYLLSQAFVESAQRNFDRRIETYLSLLAARVEVAADGRVVFSRQPGDDRFEQAYSGWYWQISLRSQVQKTSRSLWDKTLALPVSIPDGAFELKGPRDERLRGAMLPLSLRSGDEPVLLQVMGPRGEIDAESASFNWLLARSLGSLALILLAVLLGQIRWGLAPLRDMVEGLRRVRNGEAPRLDVRLPSDLRGVAVAMNEVLSHQEQLLARGRTVAGNLAHALKTPLSVLRLRLADLPRGEELRGDIRHIETIVDHHLTLAAAAGRASGVGRRTEISESLQPIIDAVRHLYAERNLQIDVRLAQGLMVAVDPQDLQELVGNLLDNAMKWANRRVRIEARADVASLLLVIEDDGCGIEAAQRQRVLGRGLRLDQRQPGTGLGLAIAKDLADLYGLQIQLDESPWGGLQVSLRFPKGG